VAAPSAFSRAFTVAAAAFLALDGFLLVGAWIWTGRPWLLVWGGICLLAVGGVLLGWRRYRRMLDELDADRTALRQDIQDLRKSLRQ
jgi:protein-S-isoprenylcysteine O-methyltransferase Ste14